MQEQGIQCEIIPAGLHWCNIAKYGIQNFRNNFVSSLCSLPSGFLMQFWDKLLQQAKITLKLLCTSHINLQLSAYDQLYKAFDYRKNYLAPPGINVQAHILLENRNFRIFTPRQFLLRNSPKSLQMLPHMDDQNKFQSSKKHNLITSN